MGQQAESTAPPIPGDEPDFTRIVRQESRWRDVVAWSVTAAFILLGAWFLPLLLSPTSNLGRIGSFATLAGGGLAALGTIVGAWRWAHRRD